MVLKCPPLQDEMISALSVCQYFVISSFVQIYIFQFILNTKSIYIPHRLRQSGRCEADLA